MQAIECGACGRGRLEALMFVAGPPRLMLCTNCINVVLRFLPIELLRDQPFLNLFEGVLDESEDGESWILWQSQGKLNGVIVRKCLTS